MPEDLERWKRRRWRLRHDGLAVQPLTSDIARAPRSASMRTPRPRDRGGTANSDAGRKGLRCGDVILSANRTLVTMAISAGKDQLSTRRPPDA